VTCEEFVELVSTYLDSVLEPEQEALFLDHLRRCPPCSVCLEQFTVAARMLAAQAPHADTLTAACRHELVAAFRAAHR
jgi:predicted anti-sigma-YlaC factor YlaD